MPPRKGSHGGFIWLFFRAFAGRILVVVAEVKKNECWIITAYWASRIKGFVIPITEPPIVEIDTEAEGGGTFVLQRALLGLKSTRAS